MLLPYAVQIGVVMYIYEGYKGGGRAIKGRARDKITLDVTNIICHIHCKLTRLTVQAQIPSSVTYFMQIPLGRHRKRFALYTYLFGL